MKCPKMILLIILLERAIVLKVDADEAEENVSYFVIMLIRITIDFMMMMMIIMIIDCFFLSGI